MVNCIVLSSKNYRKSQSSSKVARKNKKKQKQKGQNKSAFAFRSQFPYLRRRKKLFWPKPSVYTDQKQFWNFINLFEIVSLILVKNLPMEFQQV